MTTLGIMGATFIKNSAFENCTSLTDVVIGKNVAHIYNDAFGGCTNIETIVSIPANNPNLDKNAFRNVVTSNIIVYIRAGGGNYTKWSSIFGEIRSVERTLFERLINETLGLN